MYRIPFPIDDFKDELITEWCTRWTGLSIARDLPQEPPSGYLPNSFGQAYEQFIQQCVAIYQPAAGVGVDTPVLQGQRHPSQVGRRGPLAALDMAH
jgi:hypothetical protein